MIIFHQLAAHLRSTEVEIHQLVNKIMRIGNTGKTQMYFRIKAFIKVL